MKQEKHILACTSRTSKEPGWRSLRRAEYTGKPSARERRPPQLSPQPCRRWARMTSSNTCVHRSCEGCRRCLRTHCTDQYPRRTCAVRGPKVPPGLSEWGCQTLRVRTGSDCRTCGAMISSSWQQMIECFHRFQWRRLSAWQSVSSTIPICR